MVRQVTIFFCSLFSNWTVIVTQGPGRFLGNLLYAPGFPPALTTYLPTHLTYPWKINASVDVSGRLNKSMNMRAGMHARR